VITGAAVINSAPTCLLSGVLLLVLAEAPPATATIFTLNGVASCA
jgi:hypothetical protein